MRKKYNCKIIFNLIFFPFTHNGYGPYIKLIKAIAPTPHPRVELPQVQSQEASSDIDLKVTESDTEIFNGGYEQWPSFLDMFTGDYINHPRLSNVQRFYHLRYKTKGQGVIVKQFALNDNNFNLACEALNLDIDR